MAREVDLRSAGSERGKSRFVTAALAFYFAAAQDADFQADNEALRLDFAALDHEADGAVR